MQHALNVLVVRTAGGTLARRIVHAIPGEYGQCRLAESIREAFHELDEGGAVDLLVIPAELLDGDAVRRLRQVRARCPLLRVVLTCPRLLDRHARELGLDGFHVTVAEATAPAEIAALVERLRCGPIPGVALAPVASDEERRLAEIGAGRWLQGRGERLAVFGRDVSMLNLLVDTLDAFGYQVRASRHVDRAPDRLSAGGFAAAVFDAEQADDYACGVVRRCVRTVPVVVLVGFADAEQAALLAEAGASACIGKPYELSSLLWHVRDAAGEDAEPSRPVISDAELQVLLGGESSEPPMRPTD